MKKSYVLLIVFFCLLCFQALASQLPQPLWGSQPKVITAAPLSRNVKIVVTKGQGFVLVWEDKRSGVFNIYANKINEKGLAQWGDGLAVGKSLFNQARPQIVGAEDGSVIISWLDWRNLGVPAVYCQKLDKSGKPLWGKEGFKASIRDSAKTNQVLISDGVGGVLVAWEDAAVSSGFKDIYLQKIDSDGKLLLGQEGSAVCAASLDQVTPVLTADGSGGGYLAWTDYRNGKKNPDIYVQHVDNSGQLGWQTNGLVVCSVPEVQRYPAITNDRENALLVVWEDNSSTSYDIYAQRVSREGKILWQIDGIPVIEQLQDQVQSQVTPSGVVVWQDNRFNKWNIFAQKVSNQGKPLWGKNGIAVNHGLGAQVNFDIKEDPDSNVLLAWVSYGLNNDQSVGLQQLDKNGWLKWTNDLGFKVKNMVPSPRIALASIGQGFCVVWEDIVKGQAAILGQSFSY